MLNSDELHALHQIVAEGQTVVWDTPKANAVFQAIDMWHEHNRNSLNATIEKTVRNILNAKHKDRFVRAYMQIKSTGIPPKRSAPTYYDEIEKVFRDLQTQTDRGVAIVGAALLETKLGQALRLFFVPGLTKKQSDDLLKGPMAPLGSFSAKSKVAHGLGLLGPRSMKDLNIIRDIRNSFAHKLDVRSFTQPEISNECDKLSLADRTFMGESKPSNPRDRFIRAVVTIMNFLYSEIVAGSKLGDPPKMSP